MATTVHCPQWGMGITEARIVKWLKQAGDKILEGEAIVEIETAKAVQEVEAPAAGVLAKIMAAEGEIVAVRAAIAIIADEGEQID